STDLALGTITLILVFLAAWRAIGPVLPALAALGLLFMYFGPYMPGPFLHAGFSPTRIVEFMYLTTEGLFGLILGVSATYIFVFILFGAFLSATGMAQFFNDLSLGLAGHSRGGPAKVAVLASSLVGTVSGSASA